jgi:hypothetical protein
MLDHIDPVDHNVRVTRVRHDPLRGPQRPLPHLSSIPSRSTAPPSPSPAVRPAPFLPKAPPLPLTFRERRIPASFLPGRATPARCGYHRLSPLRGTRGGACRRPVREALPPPTPAPSATGPSPRQIIPFARYGFLRSRPPLPPFWSMSVGPFSFPISGEDQWR